jgi:hypothetical protein
MKLIRYRSLSVLIIASGCQAWQPVGKPSGSGSLPGEPSVVRVTRVIPCGATASADCIARQNTITLYSPRVEGDSLIGYYDDRSHERVAIHERDVVGIETRKVDPYRTAGLALGVGALVALGAVLALIVLISNTDY